MVEELAESPGLSQWPTAARLTSITCFVVSRVRISTLGLRGSLFLQRHLAILKAMLECSRQTNRRGILSGGNNVMLLTRDRQPPVILRVSSSAISNRPSRIVQYRSQPAPPAANVPSPRNTIGLWS
jgi:hypothetical protein